jgi:hypothetical protein
MSMMFTVIGPKAKGKGQVLDDCMNHLAIRRETPEAKCGETYLVKASLHTEKQKFGKKPLHPQRPFFDLPGEEGRNEATDPDKEVKGYLRGKWLNCISVNRETREVGWRHSIDVNSFCS